MTKLTTTFRREFLRERTSASVLVHCRGLFQRARIIDYSQGGMQLDETFGLFRPDPVQVELASGIRIAGKVTWSLGARVGVVFIEPLPFAHPVIVELQRKAGET